MLVYMYREKKYLWLSEKQDLLGSNSLCRDYKKNKEPQRLCSS